MRALTLTVCLLLFCVCHWPGPSALAQEVRQRTSAFGYGARLAKLDREAERQGRSDWPRIVDGETGTQVHVSFDARNNDVVLLTSKEITLSALLTAARRVAGEMNRPLADFITYEGKRSLYLDIELNDYLKKRGRRTQASVDLAALAAALRRSTVLPRPVVIEVETEEADRATLSAAAGKVRTLGQKYTFLGLDAVSEGARLDYAVEIPVASYVVALFMGGMMLLVLPLSVKAPWLAAKRRLADNAPNQHVTASPEEVQARYRRQAPMWVLTAGVPLGVVALALFGGLQKVMHGAIVLLPLPSDPRLVLLFPLVVVVPGLLSAMACRWYYGRRGMPDVTAGLSPAPEYPADDPRRSLHQLLPLPMALFLMLGLLVAPGFSSLDRMWRLGIVFGIIAAALCASAILALRSARENREEVATDHPFRVLTMELAERAGVRVKHVVRVKTASLNAYASILGTVGATQGLLDRFDTKEVTSIVAHELGHHKLSHVRRQFLCSLLLIAGVIAAQAVGVPHLKGRVSDFAYELIRGPFVGIFVLPLFVNLVLGPMRRRHEIEADRFAVALVGDPELLIQALTKLHILSEQPHALKRSDEAILSHPSLVHRVAALREATAPANELAAR